ncbi:MAG: hypothetical protein ACREUA_09815 [Burkholderiales bacterium]
MAHEPETNVTAGKETEAVERHAHKMAVWAGYRKIQALLNDIEEDERTKQKVVKTVFVVLFAFLGTLIIIALTGFIYR